jgi:hypothetical protein
MFLFIPLVLYYTPDGNILAKININTIAFFNLLCLNSITKQLNKQGSKNMELQSDTIEPVTVSDIFEVASWQRTRSTDELLGFIARREAVVLQNDVSFDDI